MLPHAYVNRLTNSRVIYSFNNTSDNELGETMSVFYVFQGETYRQERTVGYVWSPQKSRIGSINADYSTMTKIHKGDFILHNCNGKIVAISIAREDCREALKPYELMNAETTAQWDDEGYRVDTEYFDFDNPVKVTDYSDWLVAHYIPGSAFTTAGKGKQQYMCQLADEHAIFLLERAIEQQNDENVLKLLRNALSEIAVDKESEYEILEKEEINSIVDNIKSDKAIEFKWETRKEPQEVTTSSKTDRQIPKRSPACAAAALAHANFSCEYEENHITFNRKNGTPYTEPHHLIPISKYRDFDYSLDIMQNIVSLCSNCHNLLHYGCFEAKKPILEKLYNERKDALKECGIDITLEQLEAYYR